MAYKESNSSPQLVRQLIENAEEQGVVVDEYPDLVNLLYRMEIYDSIPPTIKNVITVMLDWVEKLNGVQESSL